MVLLIAVEIMLYLWPMPLCQPIKLLQGRLLEGVRKITVERLDALAVLVQAFPAPLRQHLMQHHLPVPRTPFSSCCPTRTLCRSSTPIAGMDREMLDLNEFIVSPASCSGIFGFKYHVIEVSRMSN